MNVPFKKVKAELPPRSPWPFSAMEVGECVEFSKDLAEKSRNYAHSYAAHINIKVVTRKQPDGTMRIWRTA